MSLSRSRLLLFRVDDRLLHGQVTLGWGSWLHPDRYLLVDDALARDPVGSELYCAACPEDAELTIAGIAEALEALPSIESERLVLVVRSIETAAFLLRAGVPGPVNLGGLHARPGAYERRPHLFLTEEDERLLRTLRAEGHDCFAQELPGDRKRALSEFLSGDDGAAGSDR